MDRCNIAAQMYLRGGNPFFCMMSLSKAVLGVTGRILNGPMSQAEHGDIFFKYLTSSAKETEILKSLNGQKYVT